MNDLIVGLFLCLGWIILAFIFIIACAFWYISIPLFCVYSYFKYFRKERKFEARVLEP